MVQCQERECLDYLSFDRCSAHCEYRFAGEHRSSFRNRPDVALEVKVSKIFEKSLVEAFLGAEVFDVLVVEVKVLNKMNELFKSCGDSVASAVRNSAEKDVEIDYLVLPSGEKVAVRHGKLVKIGTHREIL